MDDIKLEIHILKKNRITTPNNAQPGSQACYYKYLLDLTLSVSVSVSVGCVQALLINTNEGNTAKESASIDCRLNMWTCHLISGHQLSMCCVACNIECLDFLCLIWIILTFPLSTCRVYRDRQKPVNGTQCPSFTTCAQGSSTCINT